MSQIDVIRAWKDEAYRSSLSAAQQALIPANPAGMIELSDVDLDDVAGARNPYVLKNGTINTTVIKQGPVNTKPGTGSGCGTGMGTGGNCTKCNGGCKSTFSVHQCVKVNTPYVTKAR